MSTNIQSFSGDVDITSNVLMSSNVFIKSPGPTSNVVTIGRGAGLTDQGIDTVSIGTDAGKTGQNTTSIAIGYQAGFDAQDVASIAIGLEAGESDQGDESIAIGKIAGQTSQGRRSIAIGQSAAADGQNTQSIAIGGFAGSVAQGIDSIAIGRSSGQTTQANGTVAIGTRAGVTTQGEKAIAIGYDTGSSNQGRESVAIGNLAGCLNQNSTSVAIGPSAGRNTQGSDSIAMGLSAGTTQQGNRAVAIGYLAGSYIQGQSSVAIGNQAGRYQQGALSVAIGPLAGYEGQSSSSIAIGRDAGQTNLGNYAIAIGQGGGQAGVGDNSICIGRQTRASGTHGISFGDGVSHATNDAMYFAASRIRTVTNSTYYLRLSNSGQVHKSQSSDDRIKHNEKFITGAIKTLFKLRPQTYIKQAEIKHDPQDLWGYESGHIAQEIYYSAPELRHIVSVPPDAGDVDNYTPPPSDDPSQDPDYSMWGTVAATVDDKQIIPYLVKGIQEIVTELPRSKTTVSNTWGQNINGLVVSANMNSHKTNTVPIVSLSNVAMDKKWYGVVSEKVTDTNDYDRLVDVTGDTRIWVSDIGGTVVSGDLVTTSNIEPGFVQKQEDDIIRSYTVAKLTQDCDFTEPNQLSIKIPRRELANVTYYVRRYDEECSLAVYERHTHWPRKITTYPMYVKEVEEDTGDPGLTERYYLGDVEISFDKYEDLSNDSGKYIKYFVELEPENYENLEDAADKINFTLTTRNKYYIINVTKSQKRIPYHDEEEVYEEFVDILDENGQIVFEETNNTYPIYTLVNHGTHKAALLTCKLY
jgi:hypothetical protein